MVVVRSFMSMKETLCGVAVISILLHLFLSYFSAVFACSNGDICQAMAFCFCSLFSTVFVVMPSKKRNAGAVSDAQPVRAVAPVALFVRLFFLAHPSFE